MPNEINKPPKNPPTCAIPSIVDPTENSKENTTITPTMQANVDLTGPNLYKAVQFMMR
jgi:hypothetical protein